jgi:hypothetical protein
MNIKSVDGLKFLNVLLSNKVWDDNDDWLYDNIFRNTDIDWVNHMINTEINGKKIIKEYKSILKDKEMIEQLDIIENNIKCNC